MRRLRFLVEAGIMRLARLLAAMLPSSAAHGIGSALGSLAYRLAGGRRKIALDNLARALPELDSARRRAIAEGSFRTVGRNAMDVFLFHRYGPDSVGKEVTLEGWDHLAEAHARGKGVIVLSAHFGHWELTALIQGHRGIPMGMLVRPLDNPWLEKQLGAVRLRSGNFLIPKADGVKGLMKSLKAGGAVAFLMDQDARAHGRMVPFFGRPASTTTTPARLALRMGAAIVPCYAHPRPEGGYRIVYLPEVVPERSGDLESDVMRLTERLNEILEDWIRERPDQWFWMHRRWKTRSTKHVETPHP